MEMRSPEVKPRRAVGRRGVPGHSAGQLRGPLGGKEDENQAWLAMLENATKSVRYISRHIKKEHFIREVRGERTTSCQSDTKSFGMTVEVHVVHDCSFTYRSYKTGSLSLRCWTGFFCGPSSLCPS